jgi:hypothetical protein
MKICVSNQHACVSNQHACVSCRFNTHCVWLKKNKNKNKHRAGACRSKVYVYYDEFKVIFLMFLVGLELRISGSQAYMSSVLCTRLLCRIKYEEKISIILKLWILNTHEYRHIRVDSTRMSVILTRTSVIFSLVCI